MMKKILYIPLFVCLFLLNGCIENDIPYPVIKLQILKFGVYGQIGNSQIDNDNRTVTVNLEETVDLSSVLVNTFEITHDAESNLSLNTFIDLSSPYKITLSLYQDYEWTIKGQQTIERIFSVNNQIGETVFDVTSKRAIAYVGKNTDLKDITINELKLGPVGSVLSRTIQELSGSFVNSKTVNVTYLKKIENWTLYVFQKDNIITLEADAWANVAWLKGEGAAGVEKSFEYRRKNSEEWIPVKSSVVDNGNTFSARINNLSELTTYEYRAAANDEYGEIVEFTTVAKGLLIDGDFDNWHKVSAVWNPWADASSSQYWDTGNKGAATLGQSNVTPTDDIWSGKASGQAALLESKFIGIGSIGKFGAGSLFTGEYLRTDGTNGVLNFGRPYESYPTKLEFYYKYLPAPISHVSSELSDYIVKGNPDTLSIYIALGDWDAPVEIRTKQSDRKLFDVNDPNIIAYAEFMSAEKVDVYTKKTLELEYRATNRKPKYLIIVTAASKYGDYFTGGNGSLLYLDEMSLDFDY